VGQDPTSLKTSGPGDRLVLGSFVLLPYASYLALFGFFLLTVQWLYQYGRPLGQFLLKTGWGALALGLALTLGFAEYPGEAALKSTNFLPFIVFLGLFSTYVTQRPNPIQSLERWAFWLLIATIPINLRAIAEYLLKAPDNVAQFANVPWMAWLYQAPNYGHRADSVFGHPNVLAAYLVIVFGLGLGLCAQYLLAPLTAGSAKANEEDRAWAIYFATALIPLGVFCSGSRSGILALVAQLLVFSWLLRRQRWITWVGLAGVGSLLVSILSWGIGGRSLTDALNSSSLRLDIWQLALPLIRQSPWVGLGFGGFQNHYQPYSIPDEASLSHAHNLWLNLAVDVGVPLMILFTARVGWTCFRAVRAMQSSPAPVTTQAVLVGYGLGFLACTLFSVFDIAFFDARVNLLGWIMLAVLHATPTLLSPVDPPATETLFPPSPSEKPGF
jgi:O-antigen ligase